VSDSSIERCVAEAPDDAAVVILTHDHALDYRLARAALDRAPTAFAGLIGSATKRARFLARLARDGIAPEAIARLACPIGVAGITGKEPEVIAIAVLAQVLQIERASVPARQPQPAL
jgi:xanthine dehydrogenase accessory factor